MINPIEELEKFVNEYFEKKESLKILDAGCGSITHIKLNKKTEITGIDISSKQLERSVHLDKRICGDIQNQNFNNQKYDLIICWDVLEHLQKPRLALMNFYKAVDDGIIIIKLPNLFSIKGLITKFTPHRFHVFVYRIIFKSKKISSEDQGPFKTYLKFAVSPKSLRKFAVKNNLEVVFQTTYSFGDYWNPLGKSIFARIYFPLKKIIQFLSFGKINDTEYIIVLKKL